jgi:hypothetical protein
MRGAWCVAVFWAILAMDDAGKKNILVGFGWIWLDLPGFTWIYLEGHEGKKQKAETVKSEREVHCEGQRPDNRRQKPANHGKKSSLRWRLGGLIVNPHRCLRLAMGQWRGARQTDVVKKK